MSLGHELANWKSNVTFPVFTICAILTDIITFILEILHLTVTMVLHEYIKITGRRKVLTDHQGCESGHDRGGHSHGLDHVDHPYEGNHHDGCGEVKESDDHDEGNDDWMGLYDHGQKGHDQSRIAMKRKEVYEPTMDDVSWKLLEIFNITYLNLQHVVTTDTLIVHLMVGIICITAMFVLNESKPTSSVNDIRVATNGIGINSQTTGSSSRSWNVTTDKTTISA